MKRFCYFCRKPLGLEKRADMFCGLRCQMLYAQLGQGKRIPERPPLRPGLTKRPLPRLTGRPGG